MRVLAIDLASDGLSGTQDLLNGASQVLGHRSWSHLARDLDDLIERDAAVVLDVLHLLLVTWRLLQSLDHQRRCRWHDVDLGLTILDGELHGDAKTFPVAGVLGDIFRDFLRSLFQPTKNLTTLSKHYIYATKYKLTKPKGPIFGARAAVAAPSPPVTRRITEILKHN